MKRKMFFASILVLMAMFCSSEAAMVLDQSNTGAGATGSPLHGYSETMWMAQTFQHGSVNPDYLVAVELYKTEWFNQFPTGTTMFAEIQLTTAGVPDGTVLGRSEVVTQEGGRNSGHTERASMTNTQANGYLGTQWAIAPYWEGWARWEFAPIDISGYTAASSLAIVWGVVGPGAANYSRGGDEYAGGACYVNYGAGTTWNPVGGTDMAFTVYTDVPEPATIGMLLLGLGSMMQRQRKN